MKLWWPHNEAMIATLMAYEATGDETWWQRYEMVRAGHAHVENSPPAKAQQLVYPVSFFSRPHRWQPTPWNISQMIDLTGRCRRQYVVARLGASPGTRRSAHALPRPRQPARTGIKAAAESTASKPSGAWFGYLTREGEVSQRFIGGPYKGMAGQFCTQHPGPCRAWPGADALPGQTALPAGFFHVPRCLHRCAAILQKLAEA